jgi:CRISPR-associated protein Cas2
MKHWLVIYDICNAKRLSRIAKKMEDFGIRVQKSVFEIEADKKQIDKLRYIVNRIIEEDDFVVYFEICESDWQKRTKVGPGKYIDTEEKPFYIY